MEQPIWVQIREFQSLTTELLQVVLSVKPQSQTFEELLHEVVDNIGIRKAAAFSDVRRAYILPDCTTQDHQRYQVYLNGGEKVSENLQHARSTWSQQNFTALRFFVDIVAPAAPPSSLISLNPRGGGTRLSRACTCT